MNVNGRNSPRPRRERYTVLAGVLGAVAATSCCILPLIFFSLGVSGAWIGNLTALAPYQPYILALAVVFLGYGYWLVYRSRARACAEDAACTRPLPNKLVITGLVVGTLLVFAAIAFDLLAPRLLN